MLRKICLFFFPLCTFIIFFFLFIKPVFADTQLFFWLYAGGEAPGYPGAVDCNTTLWTNNCDRWGSTTGSNCCTLFRGGDYCSSSYSAASNLTTLSCWKLAPTPTPTPVPPTPTNTPVPPTPTNTPVPPTPTPTPIT